MRLRGSWYKGTEAGGFVELLAKRGYKAFFVGGCVRDDLLGEDIGDIDISTSAEPSRVLELAEANGFRTAVPGIEYGTVVVVSESGRFEVTSFRRDVSTDGRRASVAYHEDLEEDARRRDFTLNAIYADHCGRVLDPIGGLADLESRRIKFVGDPRTRIEEDNLRMLRFFRMAALFGDPGAALDPGGLQAIKELAANVSALPRERIGQEILGLMAAPDPAACARSMVETGIWDLLLPGTEPRVLRDLAEIERRHGIRPRRGCRNAAIRRLAAVGSASVAERLRISRKLEQRWRILRSHIISRLGVAALANELGVGMATDAALVRSAVGGLAAEENFEFELERGGRMEFPVRAHDLMPTLRGAELGRAMRGMRQAWLASDLKMSRNELLGLKPDGVGSKSS